MASPIDSVGGAGGVRRMRRKRRGAGAEATSAAEPPEESHAAAPAAPVPPLASTSREGPPALSAQLIGQSGPAEDAASANSAALQARNAYLQVEYSGPYDRRTRRGHIAKTDV